MGQERMFAFRVAYEAAGQRADLVVAAPDLVEAAGRVRQRLGEVDRVLEIRSLAEVLSERQRPAPAPSSSPLPERQRPAPAPPAPPDPTRPIVAPRQGGTRQRQLMSVLQEVAGPVHLDVIAEALGINRAYADNLALRAIRAGLVERVGVGTGLVQLAADDSPGQSIVRRRTGRGGRPTWLEQLIELLEARGEPVHMNEIAGTLGLTRTHADNVVNGGAGYGLLRRLDDRTGRVELVAAEVAAT